MFTLYPHNFYSESELPFYRPHFAAASPLPTYFLNTFPNVPSTRGGRYVDGTSGPPLPYWVNQTSQFSGTRSNIHLQAIGECVEQQIRSISKLQFGSFPRDTLRSWHLLIFHKVDYTLQVFYSEKRAILGPFDVMQRDSSPQMQSVCSGLRTAPCIPTCLVDWLTQTESILADLHCQSDACHFAVSTLCRTADFMILLSQLGIFIIHRCTEGWGFVTKFAKVASQVVRFVIKWVGTQDSLHP